MIDRRTLLAISAAVAAPAAARAQAAQATPRVQSRTIETAGRSQAVTNVGFTKARLARMHDVMAAHVASGRMPGLVTLVSRHGQTHVHAVGTMAFDGAPMRRDTIFRIASMTKPVTAAAAMILVEESKLRLDDPVDPWLPEMEDRKVLRSIDSSLDDTVPAKRAITLRHLLTVPLRYGAIFQIPPEYPIQKAMDEAGVAPSA